MSNSGTDFKIPNPVETLRDMGSPAIGDSADKGLETGLLGGLLNTGISTTDLVIAVVVMLGLLGLMLLPRKAVITSLQAQFADYARAKSAGNSLYVLLVVLSFSVTIGLLGNLWTALQFIVPVAVISIVLLIVFIISFLGARASRVGR
ncbi:MAG: hypothetical protein K9K63_07380 [Desulfotignum sp.]|nr:hypothetical protein [Desulfotignum sp.]MCF8137115.1 hypothetical protein [Desulfotignum sp.]